MRLLYELELKEAERDVVAHIEAQPSVPVVTRHQVALHEAGHFVALEVEGMQPTSVWIKGTPFGRDGWYGSAQYFDEEGLYPGTSPDRMLRHARTILAGPWSGEYLAGGSIHSSPGELLEVSLLCGIAARKLGKSLRDVQINAVVSTAALAERYTCTIEEVAEKLERGEHEVYRKNCRRIFADLPWARERRLCPDLDAVNATAQKILSAMPGDVVETILARADAEAVKSREEKTRRALGANPLELPDFIPIN